MKKPVSSQKKKKKEKPLDVFHYHEAVDRTDSVIRIMDDMLLSHWVLLDKENERLRNKVSKAQNMLSDVYIQLGKITMKKFPDQ